MKPRGRIWIAACVVLMTAVVSFSPARSLAADTYPQRPDRFLNDYAHVISVSDTAQLEAQLHKFEVDTSNNVMVAIFPKLPSTSSVADYSIHLYEAWKPGLKDKENGVILAIYIQDRQLFIVPGYGLEGALPDATCKQIIDDEITPKFKAGDYYGGIQSGVNAILQATRGEYKGTGHLPDWVFPIGIFLLIFLLQFLSRRYTSFGSTGRRSGWYVGGGGWGGGGGWSGGGGGSSGPSSWGGSTGGGGAGGSW